jgi:hypothetical protein
MSMVITTNRAPSCTNEPFPGTPGVFPNWKDWPGVKQNLSGPDIYIDLGFSGSVNRENSDAYFLGFKPQRSFIMMSAIRALVIAIWIAVGSVI